MRGSDPRDEAGDLRPAELSMSASDLVSAAVGLPSENAPKISRQVQQIALDIPVVGDHRRQNKSPLPTGMSSIVSHQPLSSSPAAGLHVSSTKQHRFQSLRYSQEESITILSSSIYSHD